MYSSVHTATVDSRARLERVTWDHETRSTDLVRHLHTAVKRLFYDRPVLPHEPQVVVHAGVLRNDGLDAGQYTAAALRGGFPTSRCPTVVLRQCSQYLLTHTT